MREPIYKAVFHLEPLVEVDSWQYSLQRANFGYDIHKWLSENERSDRFINIYTTDEPGHIIVVLKDRTTAIMLKLALG